MLLPLVLQFSCRPPVSVCGTGDFLLFSDFSRRRGFIRFATNFTPRRHSALTTGVLNYPSALCLARGFPSPRPDYPSVSSPHLNVKNRYGNIYPLSIDYAFRPRLRSRLTLGGRTFPRKPQTFDGGVSRSSLATYTGILSCMQSTPASANASARIHCSSTNMLTHIPKLRCTV